MRTDNLNTYKLSIIIPVYNKEKYIEKCLKSIQMQKFENYEVIIINDGSTDNSSGIIEKFEIGDKRIKHFYHENKGVSFSRNKGIALATGDYISFVDADDMIFANYLEYFNNSIDSEVDILVFNSLYFNNDDTLEYQLGSGNKGMNIDKQFNLKKKYKFEDLMENNIAINVWNKFYKKSFIRESSIHFFDELSYDEDVFFNLWCFYKSKSIRYLDQKLYYYRVTSDGISQLYHKDLMSKYNHAAELLLANFDSKMKLEIMKTLQYIYTRNLNSFILMLYLDDKSYKNNKDRLKLVFSNELLRAGLTEHYYKLTHNKRFYDKLFYLFARKNRLLLIYLLGIMKYHYKKKRLPLSNGG